MKRGPLESLKLAAHCQMCGSTKGYLEPAFDPSGNPKTLCRDCRIGSAELLITSLPDEMSDFLEQVAIGNSEYDSISLTAAELLEKYTGRKVGTPNAKV